MIRKLVLGLSVLPVIALGACGDGSGGGFQAVPYENIPYTMERTAGKGVTFVRAAMLPPKEAKTEAITQKTEPVAEPAVVTPEPAPAPITPGDAVFDKKQSK